MTVSIANVAATWSDGSRNYKGIGFNAITTSGNSYSQDSRLLDLSVNNNSVFSVDAQGNIHGNGVINSSGPKNAGDTCTGISAFAKRISIQVYNLVGNNTNMWIQLGYDDSFQNAGEDRGYKCATSIFGGNGLNFSAQFYQGIAVSYGFYALPTNGIITFERMGASSTVFTASGITSCFEGGSATPGSAMTSGHIDLGGNPSRYYNVRIVNGGSGNYSVQWA